MQKAYLYLRVSGNSQLEGTGFDRQEEVCRNYASNRYEIVGVFKDEAVSGIKGEMDRPAFQEMVSAILSNGVNTIIIERLDRLARAYRIQEQLIIYLASKNIILIVATTEENITEAIEGDPMRIAMVQFQGIIAELEKNLLVHRLKKGREITKQLTGRCGGHAPYGETQEEQEIIKKIKLWRRTKKDGSCLTLAQIADRLNAMEIPTRLNRKWTATQVYNITKR